MTDFPIDTVIFNKIIEVFNQTRSYVLLLFPLAFFIRIAFGFILLKADSFTDILKDSLFLFLGLFFFTDILKMTLQIPYFISSELSFGEWRNINLGEGIFTKALKRFVDWIGILSYWISFGLYVVIVSILGFFAGYILFFGTMFRAYGLLKVFFILLFTVSLWPLLWHSINFAVYTIAVSDNALANNVIVGGASLAKVFVPLWLISKTSKVPVAETLKKVSFTGGGMALAGGSKSLTLINENMKKYSSNTQNKEEVVSGGDNINIKETVVQEGRGSVIGNRPEEFSLTGSDTPFLPPEKQTEKIPQDKALPNGDENKPPELNQQTHLESNMESKTETEVSQENHVQNDINRETHIENNPQITKEINEAQNISKAHNESSLNESPSPIVETEVTRTEYNQKIFNETIQSVEWVEEGEEYIAPHKNKKEKDIEL